MKQNQTFEVGNCKSVSEVLQQTGNIWTTTESPLFDQFGNKISSHKAILREDNKKVLGIVGIGYQPMELEESFNIFDSLVQQQRLTFDSLRVFEGGKKVVLTTNLESFEIKENDRLVPKLNIVQSFDGSHSYSISFILFRLVCKNGLIMANNEKILSIKHTGSMVNKIRCAEDALESAFEYFNNMKEVSIKMINTKINESYVNIVLDKLLGNSQKEDGKNKTRTINIKNTIIDLFHHGKGNFGENKFDLVNATTEFADHFRGSEDSREYSNLLGSGFSFKQKAFNLIQSISA